MAVTVNNLVLGPGTLYKAAVGTAEPADTAVNAAPAASAWTDCGGTSGGLNLTINQTYTELQVDQIVDSVGRRITKREIQLDTALAEPTLVNLSLSLNGGTSATGSGFASWEPNFGNSASQPNYTALLVDGWAPQLSGGGNATRRSIIRKALSTAAVKQEYKENAQTVYAVQFMAHYISSVTAPIHIVDQTT